MAFQNRITNVRHRGITGLFGVLVIYALFNYSAIGQETQGVKTIPDSPGSSPAPVEQDQSDRRQSGPTAALPNAPSVSPSIVETESLTLRTRFRIYRHTLISPLPVVGAAFGAAIGQWENEPPEWGQGAAGYATRFGSGIGRRLFGETIRFGVAAIDGEDPRYHPSTDTRMWKRALHAVQETFVSQTESGSRMPAYSRFVGIYGAAFISNAWYPESRSTTGYALRRGSTALATSAGVHVVQEFLSRRKPKAGSAPHK